MLQISEIAIAAAAVLLGLSLIVNVFVVATRHAPAKAQKAQLVPASVGSSDAEAPARPAGTGGVSPERTSRGVGWLADRMVELALALITVGLITRMLHTGHAPFANQYEFAVSFGWGITAAFVYFNWRYRIRTLSLFVLPLGLGMLVYAQTIGGEAEPLIPALQNNLLLTLHVASAMLAYGAAGVSFGAAVLYLLRPYLKLRGLPSSELLDEIGYRAVVITFPLLTMMLILGMIWADIAWGRYWSWDPKETAALVTWLIYGAYLHARVSRGWRGDRSAWLLVIGFVAILFTFFGNRWFGGLHAYA